MQCFVVPKVDVRLLPCALPSLHDGPMHVACNRDLAQPGTGWHAPWLQPRDMGPHEAVAVPHTCPVKPAMFAELI